MEKIIKIAENNVEVQTIYYKDAAGKDPITIKTESYGRNRIEEESAKLQARLDYWNGVDIDAEKAAVQDDIDKLTAVQVEMDKK